MFARSSLVWLVTGCSSGFGRSIAEHLLDQGQQVVVTARRTESVQDLAQRGDALVLALDVVNRQQCYDVVARAERYRQSWSHSEPVRTR